MSNGNDSPSCGNVMKDISFNIPNNPLLLLESIIQLWRDFFKRNKDYRKYCDAKRSGDVASCKIMEGTFERLSDLYEDWGDLYDGSEADEWEAWIEPRRHLFGLCKVDFSDDVVVYDPDSFVRNIAIPKGVTKAELLKLIDGFLDRYPLLLGEGQQYTVTSVQGEDLNDMYERLTRLNYVVEFLGADLSVMGNFDFCGVKEFFDHLKERDEIRTYLKLNWNINEHDEDPSRIYKMLRDYYACVEVTIHGEFPRRPKKTRENEELSSSSKELNSMPDRANESEWVKFFAQPPRS